MAKLDPSRREAKSLAQSQRFHVGKQSFATGIDSRARRLVEHVCHLAGRPTLVSDLQRSLEAEGVLAALDQHDTPLLYNWMVRGLAYQGISDYVAHEFMEQHGAVTWSEVENNLSAKPSCPKLRSYWHFHRCGYNKTTESCNEPSRISACPLPQHTLRNGRLNQSAYSLYLFIRDLADCDLVGWIESTINVTRGIDRDLGHVRDRLSESMQGLFGVSNKMLNMIISDLLIGGSAQVLRRDQTTLPHAPASLGYPSARSTSVTPWRSQRSGDRGISREDHLSCACNRTVLTIPHADFHCRNAAELRR